MLHRQDMRRSDPKCLASALILYGKMCISPDGSNTIPTTMDTLLLA